jgi:hypothetical protein
MTRNEKLVLAALSVAVALTRWPALSATLWDWDEALLVMGVRDFDVSRHHPHPPGFPLFIALAKLIPLDGFHALQSVTFIASLFVFPAMFFVARELRLSFFHSTAAALLLSFLPNVWFFGGTALSDVPSLVLALAACALLLRGARSDASLLAGAVMLGLAASVRPQNLLLGAVPFAVAFFHRRRTALLGALIIAVIVAISFGTAAYFSGGWETYREVLARHERYIRSRDSFLSPIRPWLPQVFDDFFLRPFRAPLINIVITVLAAIGLVRARRWLAVAIFGPFLLFAWLYLDFHSASRFSIAYMPLFALLAAEGIPSRFRVVTLAAVTGLLIGWTWPALRVVHTTRSPPVAAAEAIPPGTAVYVDGRLAAHAELLLPGAEIVRVLPDLKLPPGSVLVKEGASNAPGARNFTRTRDRLDGIARARYFEVTVVPQ